MSLPIALSRSLVMATIGLLVGFTPAFAAEPPEPGAGSTATANPFDNASTPSENPDPFAPQPTPENPDPFAPQPTSNTRSPSTAPNAVKASPAQSDFAPHTTADPFGAPVRSASDERPPLRTWSDRNLESMRQLENALQSPTSVNFVDMSLKEVARELSNQHKIPIFIDVRALEEIGLTADLPVSLEVHNVSLRSCLRLLLRDLDLTYVIDDEVLQITTKESAEQRLAIALYRLDSIKLRGAHTRELIQQMVSPDIWESVGGPASITALSNETKGEDLLIVSATQEVHQKILELLNTIAAQKISNLKTTQSSAPGGH